MSKRTLDAFLVSPANSVKKAKSLSTARHAGCVKPRPSAQSVEVKGKCVEVVDLDEVIDLDSPSPPPPDSVGHVETVGEKKVVDSVDLEGKLNNGRHGEKPQTDRIRNAFAMMPDTTSDPSADTPSLDIHSNYPFPIPQLSTSITHAISLAPIKEPKLPNHLPHLDLLTYEPYLGAKESREYGEFLRRELPFYRVEYKLTRFGKPTDIKTPRFTVSLPFSSLSECGD